MSERVPETWEMSYREQVEFIGEACKSIAWLGWLGREGQSQGWEITLCDGQHIYGQTLKDALAKAASYDKEANDDF